MDILQVLRNERDRISKAIEALEGRPQQRESGPGNGRRKGRRRKLSAAAKRKISQAAKRRWAAAKKAGRSTL